MWEGSQLANIHPLRGIGTLCMCTVKLTQGILKQNIVNPTNAHIYEWKRLSDSFRHKKPKPKRALGTIELRALLLIKEKVQRRKTTFLRLHSTLISALDLEPRSPGAQFSVVS